MKLTISSATEPVDVLGQLAPSEIFSERQVFIDDKTAPPSLSRTILLGLDMEMMIYFNEVKKLRVLG